MQDEELNKKRRYFKDSVYLKYENQSNIDEHFKNKKKKFSITSKVAVALVVCTLGMGVYAGVSGNINLEKIGFLKLSENYEENVVLVDKSFENENCKINLEGMAGDGAYIVAEYKIELKENAIEEFGDTDKNLYLNTKVNIDGQDMNNIMSSVEKLSNTEYSYIQVINVMNANENASKLQIELVSINRNDSPNIIELGKTISADIKLNKENAQGKVMLEQNLDDKTKIVVEEIANTKFETFIKVKQINENVTWKEYNENPFEYNSFIISDEAGKQIPCQVYSGDWYGKKYYKQENGEYKEVDGLKLKDEDVIKVEENYVILVGVADTNKINIEPVKSRLYNDRTNEEATMYEKATWYPVKASEEKYLAQSGLGGTFEIQKIEVDDENIVFYYEEDGTLGNEWKLIVRENNGIMNYVHPIKEERKNINSKENKITFQRDTSMAAGLNLHRINMDNIDNLEFTMLFGCVTEKIGEVVDVEIPPRNEETAKIENINIE